MLSRVFSSPYRVSVTRGLRVGMMTPIPRLFHTSISVSVIHERIRDKTTLKDVAPKAREEMAQSINDTVLPGGSTDADTDTEEDVDPEKHPIETAKRIIQDITEWKYRDHIHDSVVNLIKKDHTNIDRLYRIYQNVTVDANTKLLMGQIIIRESKLSSLKSSRHDGQSHAFEYVMLLPSIYVVCVHSNAEEMSVYPIIDSDISHDQAKQARTAHSSIERLLKELDDLTLWDEEYDYRMKTAIENFRTHVQYEESQLLKLLESHESQQELIELGDAFQDMKWIAPTHPHPRTPKTGILGAAAIVAEKTVNENRGAIRLALRDSEETNPSPS